MSNEPTRQLDGSSPGGDPPFCVRQFAMVTFQEYSYRRHGADAESWMRERFGA
jgi:hypothetical protein